MSKSRHMELLETSVSVMISAIETYNKPDHKYREETFSILALNSWELLMKAKILKESSNNIKSLYIYEYRTNKDKSKSKKKYIKMCLSIQKFSKRSPKSLAVDSTNILEI
jgi:hypothetical protein